ASETTLRQALIEDRLRVRVPVGGEVGAVALSPDGRLLAAAAPHKRVLVVDLRGKRVPRTLRVPGGAAGLHFQDRTVLVATSPDGALTAWTLGTGRREVGRPRPRGALGRAAAKVLQVVRTHGFVGARVREPSGHVRARSSER